MKIAQYLDRHISSLLGDIPFKDWTVERYLEEDLDELRIYYVFKERGLELFCDLNERVRVIFLYEEECDGVRLSEIPFTSTRKKVLEQFGAPSKSGCKISDPILGESGAWDRFTYPGYAIHVEYRTDTDEIRRITVMRGDAIP